MKRLHLSERTLQLVIYSQPFFKQIDDTNTLFGYTKLQSLFRKQFLSLLEETVFIVITI